MKKLLLFFVCSLMIACSAEKPDESIKVASLTIKNTETVEYKYQIMGAFPTEGGPQITKHPKHYSVSKLDWHESGIFYLFTPEAGFTGTVTIEITNFLHNGAEVYDKEVTKLTIKVTE